MILAVRSAKTQINLSIRPFWSESSLCAKWLAKDLKLSSYGERRLWSDWADCPFWSESSLGAHTILLVLSWAGSFDNIREPASVAQLDARPTGDQEVVGATPAGSAIFFGWDWLWNIFYVILSLPLIQEIQLPLSFERKCTILHSLFPFRWFKEGSCQFLAKENAQYWLTA